MYFCRGCDTNIDYDKFEMIEQKNSQHRFIKCKYCQKQTCIIQCQACKQYKFKDISDQDVLLSCTCGIKQRIFKCKGCSQVQCINSQQLEQSTKIKCGSCLCQQYQINCPDCKALNGTLQTHQMITCYKCSLQFTMAECPVNKCGKETISRDQNLIRQFKCSQNHVVSALSCIKCKQQHYMIGQEITFFQCTSCRCQMRQILCQCGIKQIIEIKEQQRDQKYKCTKCQFSFILHPCDSQNCNGLLSEIDVGILQPQPNQTNFARSTIVLCQNCRLRSVIVRCLRCQHVQVQNDDGTQLPQKCSGCDHFFEDNRSAICTICQDKKVEILFSPCNHMVSCTDCSEKLQTSKCPICRQISQKQKVYFS